MLPEDEREEELAWFGITVEPLDRRVMEGRDPIALIPTVVRMFKSATNQGEQEGLEFFVLPEQGSHIGETKSRAINEARALAALFLRLTECRDRGGAPADQSVRGTHHR